ncbi:MAG TPA: hypothetical protein VFZ48_05245 [Candidatus Saccharimonadales bacterium]
MPAPENEQLVFDLFPPETPKSVEKQKALESSAEVVQIDYLRTQLGIHATAESLADRPYYELGGGIAEAEAAQETDGLMPFAKFIESYTPQKKEVAALFEQYRFHELGPGTMGAMSATERGKLAAHVVQQAYATYRRGQIMATEGAFGGSIADQYGFTSEAETTAYGEELMNLASTVFKQPTFTYLESTAQRYLDTLVKPRPDGQRPKATAKTREEFVAADRKKMGKPQVTADYRGAVKRLHLTYGEAERTAS